MPIRKDGKRGLFGGIFVFSLFKGTADGVDVDLLVCCRSRTIKGRDHGIPSVPGLGVTYLWGKDREMRRLQTYKGKNRVRR